MKNRSIARSVRLVLVLLLAASVAAQAAEVRVLTSPGFVPIFGDLVTAFERASGHKLVASGDTLGAIVKRVRGGEEFDVIMSPRSAIDGFVKDGKGIASSVTVVASAGLGVAVRPGTPKPDISSPEAFRRALLAAKSITYPDPNNLAGNPALGIHFTGVLERLGITEAVKSKTVVPGPRDIGKIVAGGEAELGVAQMQNLARTTGIEIVGPLPADLQDPVDFAAVIMTGARDAEASKAFIEFMRTPAAAAALRTQRLDPR